MILINFSHPLTAQQQQQLTDILGQAPERMVQQPAQLDPQQGLAGQSVQIVDQVGLSPEAWQGEQILVVLPSLNYLAAAVLAELHGRMGYFPPLVRIRPVPSAVPPRFEVAEVVNLQELREQARERR